MIEPVIHILNEHLPAQIVISRGHGSCLLLDFHHRGGKPSIMIDKCRWVVVSEDQLVFYDYDIADMDDLALLSPYRLTSITRYPDLISLDFGQHRLLLFWTQQSQEYFYPGVIRGGEEWENLPQDERDNVTIFSATNEPLGIEFQTVLDPLAYAWGEEFMLREAQLPDDEPTT
ncbi:hypothetical protein [Agrobacterium rosae]|uniref:hypothetical protein n=1 Tax=Agrobacterium rosae TaxID=1972867 RepID=UPI002A0D037E|nr:hypothetical protein [Agrobacterium rosae]MDX8316767.1 hypothetical protein [Agrobacterium rosae]